MDKKNQIYEGKAKKIFETDDSSLVIQYFKDDATAFDGKKHALIDNKGSINCRFSAKMFEILTENGLQSHFIKLLDDRQMLVKRLTIIPVEVVVRNVIAGSLAKRFGLEEGARCPFPILEFYYKSDELHDPFINEDHIKAFRFADEQQINAIKQQALKVNQILQRFFDERGVLLVDFKLEFGVHDGQVMLGDEITPDTCRLWDKVTLKKMDKDRFRRDLGQVQETYEEALQRVVG